MALDPLRNSPPMLDDPELTVVEADKFEGAGALLQLQFAEQNLVRQLEGKSAVLPVRLSSDSRFWKFNNSAP